MMSQYVSSIIAILIAAAPIPGVAAPADDSKTQVMALVNQTVDAFNNGDVATIKKLSPATSIIDEMPPFAWQGPGATDAWLADVERDNQRMNDTDGHSTLDPPRYFRADGDDAYAVIPDHFSYKRAGVQVNENAILTIKARRTADGWRIVAWSYSADQH